MALLVRAYSVSETLCGILHFATKQMALPGGEMSTVEFRHWAIFWGLVVCLAMVVCLGPPRGG